MTQGSNTLHFFYDASNKPAIVEYNGVKYAYVHNLQGDIVAILDSNGTAVVQYKYDAWGRQIDCTFEAGNNEAEALSTVNPFRYRGYVYDEETGLYYLRSRYYKSGECRFINADSYLMKGETFDLNCFVYSMNRPVMFYDPNGTCSSCASIEQLVSRKTVSDNDFNDTVTLGMRKLLYNANDYYYVGKSKTNDGGIDCIWAVNKAVGKNIAKKVDSAWSYYARLNTPRGRIYDLNDLQPGDIVFSIDRRDRYYGKDVADIPKIDPVSKGHIGVVVLFDFGDGNGEVLAVFQSCSVPLDPQEWTALYYGDTGPNITALADNEGNSNWKFYVRPK